MDRGTQPSRPENTFPAKDFLVFLISFILEIGEEGAKNKKNAKQADDLFAD